MASNSPAKSPADAATKYTMPPTAGRPRFSPKDLNRSGPDYVSAVVPPTPAGEASGFDFGSASNKWAALQSGPLTSTAGITSAGTGGGGNGGGFSWGSGSPSLEQPAAGGPTRRTSSDRIRTPSHNSHTNSTPPANLSASPASPFFPPTASTQGPSPNSSSTASAAHSSSAASFSHPSTSTFSFNQSPAFPSMSRSRNNGQSSATTLTPTGNVNSRFVQLSPSELIDALSSAASTTSILVLDMRTHTAFVQSHLRRSISICVPSTLLRRPGYGIERVADGLNPVDQAAFAAWQTADSIVVLDGDSNTIADASGIASLLSKFDKAGSKARLSWVKGGWAGIQSYLQQHGESERSLIESGTSDGTSPDGYSSSGSGQSGSGTTIGKKHARPVLQVRDLPASAFQQSSTSAFANSGMNAGSMNLGGRPTGETSRSGAEPRTTGLKRRKSGVSGYGLSLSSRDGADASVHQPPSTGERRVATNPFFDNIRQNSEALSLERSMANLAPVDLKAPPSALLSLLPPYLVRLLELEPMNRAEVLARQFYELEVAERERLEGTLNWHATVQGRENESNKAAQRFQKYGISAGVELGSLNRFKNIFPYDHSRVRLQRHDRGATDYVNASHVHLQGSTKRFIASQGPLPATYHDFWQLCDQEQVGVIVMLTNLHEGGREKCGRYWIDEPSSGWQVETEGGENEDARMSEAAEKAAQERAQGGFFAPSAPAAPPPEQHNGDATIRRTIKIRRRSQSSATRPRKIRHIQYRAWPDFDIPAAPEDIIGLVREVDQAQKDYLAEIEWKGEVEPPIVTHCSAGCGRTGVFILVSTILEQMRLERARVRARVDKSQLLEAVDHADEMEVDPSSPVQSRTSPFSKESPPRDASSTTPVNATFPPTPSTLIPQTASLSLGPTSRPTHAWSSPHSPSPSPLPAVPNFSGHEPTATSSPLGMSLPGSISGSPSYDGEKTVPSLQHADPIFAGVNEMRQQRMSMIANAKQFIAVHEAILCGALWDIKDELERYKSDSA